MVDLHCHILPGIDDGAKNIDESLKMLRKAATTGVEVVVATPHFIRGSYEVGFREREQITADLQKAAEENGIKIQVKSGVECYLSPGILEDKMRLEQLTVNNNGKYILVELPMQNIPPYTEETLFNLTLQGITPILAHPERNMEICRNTGILFDFILKGYVVQLNMGSIMGYFGSRVKKIAKSLINHNLVHVIASDMHSANSPALGQAIPLVESLVGTEQTAEMFIKIPHQILVGEPFDKQPPKQIEIKKRGLRSFFFRWKI